MCFVDSKSICSAETDGGGAVDMAANPQHIKALYQKKTVCLVRVASVVHALLKNCQCATKREIFYRDVAMYGTQTVSDAAIKQLANILRVPRRCLNVVASEGKGLVTGNMKLSFSRLSDEIDCSAGNYHCNEAHGELISVNTTVDYVLVFESESTFNVAVCQNCSRYNNCVLVTGKGYPDYATTGFVASLARLKPELPVFVICDSDPDGVHILCSYAFGSLANPTVEGWMHATPSVRWLGIHVSDPSMHSLSAPNGDNVLDSCSLPLSENDKNKCSRLLESECLVDKPQWKEDLRLMLQQGVKIETESVATQHPAFFVQEFIPHKIQFGHWY